MIPYCGPPAELASSKYFHGTSIASSLDLGCDQMNMACDDQRMRRWNVVHPMPDISHSGRILNPTIGHTPATRFGHIGMYWEWLGPMPTPPRSLGSTEFKPILYLFWLLCEPTIWEW